MLTFKPKNSNFLSYATDGSTPTVLTPRLFSTIIFQRSKTTAAGSTPAGGTTATEYFVDQIDTSQPEAFTLIMMPFEEWHEAMPTLEAQLT